MKIKNIRLIKGMNKKEVNQMISEWITLEDDIYLGVNHKHDWKCNKCNGLINRSFSVLRRNNNECPHCRRIEIENKNKDIVSNIDGVEYIRTYMVGEYLSSKGKKNNGTLIEIKHSYCGNSMFIRNDNNRQSIRCKNCCGSYENSFAYYIEVELGKPLEKYWDFEKNTLNPYHIYKGTHKKAWINCQDVNYHDSYEVSLTEFTYSNSRCPYCHNFKVHPKDSFAQYHIDNTDSNFLEKYWDYEKNNISPWEIKPFSSKRVWIKCNNEEVNNLNGLMKKDYHSSYIVKSCHFSNGSRCSYCCGNMIHPYDSFGYHHFDKAQSGSLNNKDSLFKMSKMSSKDYKFICPKCRNEFQRKIGNAAKRGVYCAECSMSEGEKVIANWLRCNDINYKYEKTYNGLLGVNGSSLSYDFYLPYKNLLIEYQGEFHDGTVNFQSDVKFKTQKEHDKRKRKYAKDNGIKLLEIWYYDFDKIEEILEKEL